MKGLINYAHVISQQYGDKPDSAVVKTWMES